MNEQAQPSALQRVSMMIAAQRDQALTQLAYTSVNADVLAENLNLANQTIAKVTKERDEALAILATLPPPKETDGHDQPES